ncbi:MULTISPECIES: TlpA family protein disulfide reductase [unclassified Sedimentibacter]|uniref:TlpA family protein disulfide reductase n=1 Tax=unclassified Sedimentibacter TaxID=2649220 RepID=UPI0027DF8914|nr:TlpA disulfide reductase family protein [Sedimentibacter sp. MB35-C1]WMJ77368.1 TlpA disulfide reductase family protein [Sedimentibacter sp. MB35-C1]
MKKLLLIIGLIALLATGCTKQIEEIPNEEEIGGQETESEQEKSAALIAPDFELKSLDGTTVKLSELRDKNVILNFWATWCDFCVIEMPDLQKLQEAHKDDLLVLTVNVGESKEVVQGFLEENGLDINVVLDEDMSVAGTYGVRSFPTTISINKKGEAVQGYVGMLSYEQMEQLYGFFEE